MVLNKGSIGFDIKRTADAMQTDLDTVAEPEIGTGVVSTAKLSGAAVTIAKIETTRIINGMMVYISGADLWILASGGAVMITGAGATFSPSPTAADMHVLATIATTGCEKVGIVEASGDGKVYVKYGTEVTLDAGTATYPSVDSGCIKIANLFYPVSGSSSKHPIYEDEDTADQIDNFGLESSNDIQRW